MDKSKVLSPEEVEVILKAAQDKDMDLSKLISRQHSGQQLDILNNRALGNIIELTWAECEKIISSFLRKKVTVRPFASNYGKLSECLEERKERQVFTVFKLPTNFYGLGLVSYPCLDLMINALFGGVIDGKDQSMEEPGNVGLLVAEKLAELLFEAFSVGCKEYGRVDYELIKSVIQPNLISKLSMDDEVYTIDYKITLNEVENNLTLVVPLEFLQSFVPSNPAEIEIRNKTSHPWRRAIEHQVIDSEILVVASLPVITMKASELMTLKEGDVIPISDPTLVDVYLNDVKLFQATAAQANEQRIIKILSET